MRTPPDGTPRAASRPAMTVVATPPSGPLNGAAAGLAIPGYDALSASQVVERLAGLPEQDLDEVRGYEAAHRNRRTILGKIDQLRS